MADEWRDILGYEKIYQVSNTGKVRSLNRAVWNPTKKGGYYRVEKGKELSLNKTTSQGYIQVQLRKNGIKKLFYVHRLVAGAFIKNPDNKRTVNHRDFNKRNNNSSNLEWATYSENKNHAVEAGYVSRGVHCHLSKLNPNIVRSIRKDSNSGHAYKDIAIKYGISSSNAHAISNRITWKHIK